MIAVCDSHLHLPVLHCSQLACSLGHTATMKLICTSEHAMINHEDLVRKETALVRACSLGHEDIVQVLLDHPSVDVNRVSATHKETALHATCR